MFGNYIDFRIFFVSLAVGLFLVYIYQPTPTVIYVYPTPDNIDKLQFKDKANNCYHFKADEIKCPKDKNTIQSIPVQDGNSIK